MPLKYIYDMPEAVKLFGWAHGVLFIAYVAQLLNLAIKLSWGIERVSMYFVAALLPFAPFFVERRLKEEYR